MVQKYAIHPGIGIARVGDSPEQYFIGPEAPGRPPVPARPGLPSKSDGFYKDDQKRIKRQGARFRIYETTLEAGHPQVREITAANARIEWRVHLRNGKAAAPKFTFRADEPEVRRNQSIPERSQHKGASGAPEAGVAPSGGAQRAITAGLGRWPPQEPMPQRL